LRRYYRQQGVALMTVLLVFALVTLIASEIVARVYVNIKQTGNQLIAAQAYQYALGGEAFTRQILRRDFEFDQQEGAKDHLGESWATLSQRYEFDQGVIEISIHDLQARLNINNLVDQAGMTNVQSMESFKRLLNNQVMDIGLVTAWVDWLDRDILPQDLGTEDEGYLALEKPYRTGNQRMTHLSEIRLTKGMQRVHIEKLQPYLTALPEPTAVNINTAPAEVLKALIAEVDDAVAERIIEARGKSGFASLEALRQHESMAGLTLNEADFTVRTEYFEVLVRAYFAGREVWLKSILYRDAEKGIISLISRDRSGQFEWQNEPEKPDNQLSTKG